MDPDASGGWRFAQCFGDKGDVEDITEGIYTSSLRLSVPGVAHIASCTAAPQTLARLPLHCSCSLAHALEIWTADIISAVEFDSSGNYLATGDKGGRVVLFERNDMVRSLPPLTPMAALSTVANATLSFICGTRTP
jgi:serine/threonine-protein phosphatase 2A regulatory subunit B